MVGNGISQPSTVALTLLEVGKNASIEAAAAAAGQLVLLRLQWIRAV